MRGAKARCAATVFFVWALALGGCGDGTSQNEWGGTTRVQEIDTDDDVLVLDDGAVFRFNFSFNETHVFDDHEDIHLVIKLPAELSYRESSAEIDGFSSREDDSVEPRILRCGRNQSYLSFSLTRYNLDQAEPPSEDADAQLKLTLDAKRLGEEVIIEAAADDSRVPFGCTTTFVADERQVVSVR